MVDIEAAIFFVTAYFGLDDKTDSKYLSLAGFTYTNFRKIILLLHKFVTLLDIFVTTVGRNLRKFNYFKIVNRGEQTSK